MRALVLCPYLPDAPDHGGRIRSRVFLRALAAHCDEVEVAVPASELERGPDVAAAVLGFPVHALPAGQAGKGSLPRKLHHWVRGRSELLARRWGGAARARVAELLRDRPDHLLVADASFALPLLSSRPRRPFLLHLHNIEAALLRRPGTGRSLTERVQRAWEARLIGACERRAAAAADLSITVSEADRGHLAAMGVRDRVEVVENSIDTERLSPLPLADGDSTPLLLFVGSLEYPPNREAATELVCEHLPVLRSAHPGLRVRLVGHDPHGVAAQLASADGVEATGRVDDLVPHYRAATAVYLPIRSGGGTRIKVLEAFAVGRPVLSTAVGVEGLDLQPERHYVPFESVPDGAAALQRLLAGDPREMVAAARDLAERRFSHTAAIERFRALFARYLPPA